MKSKKGLLTVLAVALALILGAAAWVLVNYHIVSFRLYPKKAQQLDLRGQEITVEDFETLQAKMPQCQIRWDVPFQGGLLADDATKITLETLSEGDVAVLDHLKDLKTVDAKLCNDFGALLALQQRRPEVAVQYDVPINGINYREDTTRIEVDYITGKEIGLLPYLTRLETVVMKECTSSVLPEEDIAGLQNYCRKQGIGFFLSLGGEEVSDTEKRVTVTGITDGELSLLAFLPELRSLHLTDPQAEPESIFALEAVYPNADITWEVELGGLAFDQDAREVDLSMVVIEDLALVEQRMAYLPKAETVIFGLCGIDEPKWENSRSKLAASPIENEDMAAYRDRVRDQYKVVWTLRLGPSIALRSDADNFMPNHFGVGQLPDSYAYNLRYCEDMVCLDVGHMTLTDISFVEFMPKLKYLILAWTEVQYIEPIRTCKNLIFLEVDNSCIRDYSPIADCTALEDLNLGNTFCDITPILEMTWLKNLYMIFGNGGDAWKASQALPNTRVVASGNATVGGGWRRLPNYYDMRDCLGMYYMN